MNAERITLIAQLVLSLLVFSSFDIALYMAWFAQGEIPAERLRIVDTMVGSLGTLLTVVGAYWFARQRNAIAAKEGE